jgi:hypothetical protein
VTTFEKTAQTVKAHKKKLPPKLKTQLKGNEAFHGKTI